MGVEPIVTAQTQVDPQFWLNAATQAIRNECGWHVAPIITETLVLDGTGGPDLLVPSLRVRSLSRVVNDGTVIDPSEVKFSRRAGVLTLRSGWSREVGSIEIEMTHGYTNEEVADVAGLIVTLTQRAAAGARGVAQQSIGPASVKYGTGRDGAPLAVPLMESEKETLAPYRLTWGP